MIFPYLNAYNPWILGSSICLMSRGSPFLVGYFDPKFLAVCDGPYHLTCGSRTHLMDFQIENGRKFMKGLLGFF